MKKQLFIILLMLQLILPVEVQTATNKNAIFKSHIKLINNDIKILQYQIDKERTSLIKIQQAFQRAIEYGQKLQQANFKLTDKQALKYGLIIDKYSQKRDIDPDLIIAIIIVESSAQHKVISHKGAIGLMQVRLCIWSKEFNISKKDLIDPESNIRYGTKILKKYIKRYKSITKAVTAYNHGRYVGANKYALKVFDIYWHLKYGKIN